MFTYDGTAQRPTGNMAFENMTLGRSSDGTLFEHLQPTPDFLSERLIRCRFKDLYVQGPAAAEMVHPTTPLIHIQGRLECVFDNVWTDGGNIGIHLENCSHMRLRGVGTTTDTWTLNGILIVRVRLAPS
jgi:hypothetical protein